MVKLTAKFSFMERHNLTQVVIEGIANILGDTKEGLNGSEIHKCLLLSNIEDVDDKNTKRIRLYNAFAKACNESKCSNQVLKFITVALAPERYVNDRQRFESLREKINQQLAFCGYKYNADGSFSRIERASTISDVEIKAKNLKMEIDKRKSHIEISKYCKAELLQNNYFHAVFEANKGLFQRIRDLSGVAEDGNKLIEFVFSTNPVLIINNYITKSEKDEHSGFANLLKGLCGMFRNPEAHEPKVLWNIDEQDALEILGIISYCHRRLDNAQKIRMV